MPPDRRQVFKSSPTKKAVLSSLMACSRLRNIWSTQASQGWGNRVCHVIWDPPLKSVPSLPHSGMQTQMDSLVGTCSSMSCGYKIFHLPPESVCCRPGLNWKEPAFWQLPCLCPLCTRWRRAWKEGVEMVKWERRARSRDYNARMW